MPDEEQAFQKEIDSATLESEVAFIAAYRKEIDSATLESEVAFIAAYRNLMARHLQLALAQQWNRPWPDFDEKAVQLADGVLTDEERTIAVARDGGLALRRPIQKARARARFLMRRARR